AELEGPAEELPWIVDGLTRELLAQRFGEAGRFPAEVASREAVSIAWLRSFLEGERALERGSYARAVTLLSAAVARDPSSAVAHYRLSQAAHRSRDAAAAEAAAARAVELRGAVAHPGERERVRLEAWRAFLAGDAAR